MTIYSFCMYHCNDYKPFHKYYKQLLENIWAYCYISMVLYKYYSLTLKSCQSQSIFFTCSLRAPGAACAPSARGSRIDQALSRLFAHYHYCTRAIPVERSLPLQMILPLQKWLLDALLSLLSLPTISIKIYSCVLMLTITPSRLSQVYIVPFSAWFCWKKQMAECHTCDLRFVFFERIMWHTRRCCSD